MKMNIFILEDDLTQQYYMETIVEKIIENIVFNITILKFLENLNNY